MGSSCVRLFVSAAVWGEIDADYKSILSGCPLKVPPDTWPPAIAYQGVHISAADSSMSSARDGLSASSRTLTLNGVCSSDQFSSDKFRYVGGTEAWMANTASSSKVMLMRGAIHCSLEGLSISERTDSADDFELRLQFNNCNGSSDGVNHAAVVVNLERRPKCASNLVPWMCTVGPRQGDGSCTHPTPAPTPEPMKAPGQVSLSVHAVWKEVGRGKCNSPGLIAETQADPGAGGPSSQAECRNVCIQALARTQILANPGAANGPGCRGFAYNNLGGPMQCIIYKSPSADIIGSDSPHAGGWTCWSIQAVNGSFDHTAPAAKVSAAPTKLQLQREKLHLFDGYADLPASGVLKRLAPPKDNLDCYTGVDWYTLEDEIGVPSSVCVTTTDWPMLRMLVPPAKRPCCASWIHAPGSLTVDRVCVDACGSGTSQCQDAGMPPAPSRDFLGGTSSDDCQRNMVLSGLASGLSAALLTLALVKVCCPQVKPPAKRYQLVMNEYTPGSADPTYTKELAEGTVFTWDYT